MDYLSIKSIFFTNALKISLFSLLLLSVASCQESDNYSIDRHMLVARHNIVFTEIDSTEIPQVGNGEIAFGIDVTGLQTFYGNTMSQWGWHTNPLPEGKSITDFQMVQVEVHGRRPTYPVSRAGQEEMYGWLRKNPHRMNLGKLSFLLDGKTLAENQLTEIDQKLDLWSGTITSTYQLIGQSVNVTTICDPDKDELAVQVISPLLSEGRLTVKLSFPYGNPDHTSGADWKSPDKHQTSITIQEQSAVFNRVLDADFYQTHLSWQGIATVRKVENHEFVLSPSEGNDSFSFNAHFTKEQSPSLTESFDQILEKNQNSWEYFWSSGGAIDLSQSTDTRWKELERRIVLSQYLLAVNEAGSLPPQESGLLLNSGWYGKFHLEMHWWHGAHYQLWDRWELFEKSLVWYSKTLEVAKGIASRQEYEGARWPKMIGPDGRFAPSKIGPWLIWQQPHPIFYAEQNYRLEPTAETLNRWKDIVFETANFMASYADFNDTTGTYELGPWVINAAENNHSTKHTTINPIFELAYWRYGLDIANKWRERLGLKPNEKWSDVLDKLAPLPIEDDVFVMYKDVPEMWTRFNNSHVDVIGPGAFLPMRDQAELNILNNTLNKAWSEWDMESSWGWDPPWLAMAAARVGQPKMAIDALMMDMSKNYYSKCGINKGGPAGVYFPGNGGLLYATAMMAAGWDNGPEHNAPGFPTDGTWIVRHEGILPAQ